MTSVSSLARLHPLPASKKGVSQLDDAHWLRMRYAVAGDLAIATELGVDRKTVRRARARHGIPSHPVGPRRGVPRPAPRAAQPSDELTPFERKLIERLRADKRSAATEALLAQRLHNAHDAKRARDTVGYEEALFAVSTVAARIAQHSRRLRNAA